MTEVVAFASGVGATGAVLLIVAAVRNAWDGALDWRLDELKREAGCPSWSPAPLEDDFPLPCDRRRGHKGRHTAGETTWEVRR
ncbi:hypothetical protein [Georgenia sp. MJ170]|uniref:hypothetical protein n=1 Tax=Georgenia sunbinii TaxID=3117728 RepID=UPI002F25EC6F